MNKNKVITIKSNNNIEYKEIKFNSNISQYTSLVQIKFCGLCGSDVHRLKSLNKNQTIILGHEITGTVIKTQNKNLLNKNVAIKPIITCQKCKNCKKKDEKLCENIKSYGKDFQGGFAKFIIVNNDNLKILNNKIKLSTATLLDSIAVSVHSYQLANINNNNFKKVLIIGDGTIGLCTMRVFQYFKKNVTILGKNKHCLEVAKKYGAKTINNIKSKNILKSSFDVVIETVGRNQDETLNLAINFCKPNGNIIILGVYPKDYKGKINLRELFYKQILLKGSNSYSYWNNKDEFDIALKIFNKIEFKNIITHKYNLKEFNKGLNNMINKKIDKTIKVIFTP